MGNIGKDRIFYKGENKMMIPLVILYEVTDVFLFSEGFHEFYMLHSLSNKRKGIFLFLCRSYERHASHIVTVPDNGPIHASPSRGGAGL